MNKKIIWGLIVSIPAVLLSAGLLAGCAARTHEAPKASETAADDARQDAVLSFDSFDGGGPEYTLRIDDPAIVSYTSERRYRDADHDEIDGAGYTVVFTLRGLRPGETTVSVSARSPIADNFDEVYRVRVDDALRVTVERQIGREDDADSVPEPEPES